MNLPDFIVEELNVNSADGSSSMLAVTCPRRDCGGEFWVPHTWSVLRRVEGNGQVNIVWGRPCPHCSRTAAIPPAFAIKPKQSRIVRRRRKS